LAVEVKQWIGELRVELVVAVVLYQAVSALMQTASLGCKHPCFVDNMQETRRQAHQVESITGSIEEFAH
jgi:hypothetical protein